MEYARRRCGRSCLGPGFESPRLHSVPLSRKLTASQSRRRFAFPIGEWLPIVFSFATSILQSGYSCDEIANAAIEMTRTYGSYRDNIFETIWSSAVQEATNALARILPTGTLATGQVVTMGMSHVASATALHIVGWYWNSKNCRNQAINFGTVWIGGRDPQAPCEQKYYHFSLDNGRTWYGVWGTVCVAVAR